MCVCVRAHSLIHHVYVYIYMYVCVCAGVRTVSDAFDFNRLSETVKALRSGRSVDVPIYDHQTFKMYVCMCVCVCCI